MPSSSELAALIRRAGVVGAGGAGFPSYVKASSRAETVIVNAAECEPLLQKDQELLRHFAPDLVRGLELMVAAVGASRGAIAIKEKHEELVKLLERAVAGKKALSVHRLADYYPAGDEFCQVYEVTGKLIPMGGIPLQVGVVVNNVETLYNMAHAERTPVVDTFLTVTGAVKNPCTLRLPVGVSISEAVALAGGASVPDPVALDGGAMMGKVVEDFSAPLTKTSGGLIILPREHPLVRRKSAGRPAFDRAGKSTCDQCTLCTELCPRYLLGYDIQPHKVMRSLLFSPPDRKPWSHWALLCCECRLCSLFACPENLNPGDICGYTKGDLAREKINWKSTPLNRGQEPRVHPIRPWRQIPVSQLKSRLGLEDYEAEAPLRQQPYAPKLVRIPLKQHVGVPAQAKVSAGQTVKRGDLIGDVPEDALGVPVHASISGKVTAVEDFVEITA
ncbi:MAG: 4Fe-4S dicluster domain-containing protein [Elusimicrobia bacterium]|nr:4Fe-4S dicluster domain-containing protein [Elusimicrobiota bacterium]